MSTFRRPVASGVARAASSVLVVAIGLALQGCGTPAPSGPTAQGSASGHPAGPSGAPASLPPLSMASTAPPLLSAEARARGVAPAGYDGRYRGRGLVTQCGESPPLVWFGAVSAQGGPPGCGGTVMVGWDWDAVPAGSVRSEDGVRWGWFVVTGAYDGEQLTITDPAEVPSDDRVTPPPPGPSNRCPVPPGGWRGSVPSLADQQGQAQAAHEAAKLVDGFTGFALDPRHTVDGGRVVDEPARAVVVVTTTGDITTMEEQVRTVWTGDLCVRPAPLTEETLRRVQAEVGFPPGHLSSGPDDVRGVLEIEVVHATQEQQDAYDLAHGVGVVELSGALRPVD